MDHYQSIPHPTEVVLTTTGWTQLDIWETSLHFSLRFSNILSLHIDMAAWYPQEVSELSLLWFIQADCRFLLQFPCSFTAFFPFFAVIADDLFDCVCWWCYSSNITVPFPFYHFIPLIPLSALDVGEATAPALPPTLLLHYSLHTIILLPPTLRHGSPSFLSLYITLFKICPVCLCHHMSYVHCIKFMVIS